MLDIGPTRDPSQTVYDLIGPEGFERLLTAFYRRVATDPVLRPMYEGDDLGPAERRLRLFLEQFFGGPTTYQAERGHPRLRQRHAPFPIDQQARDVWMAHMVAALGEAAIPEPARSAIRVALERTATHLINIYHVESGTNAPD